MKQLGFWKIAGIGAMSCVLGAGFALAKLPQLPMDDAAKAKAEQDKAKAADAAKLARDQEEKAMDRVAERYKREKGVKTAAAADPKKK